MQLRSFRRKAEMEKMGRGKVKFSSLGYLEHVSVLLHASVISHAFGELQQSRSFGKDFQWCMSNTPIL